jgi:methyl-accepting chemotaxis protein
MINAEITSSLDLLHKELERLSPAVDIIDRTNSFSEEIKKIPKLHIKLVEQLKELEKEYKSSLKDELSSSSKEIKSNIDELIANIDNYSKTLSSNLEKELSKNSKEIKSNLDKVIVNIDNYSKSQITNIEKELLTFSQEIRSNIDNVISKVEDHSNKLVGYTEGLAELSSSINKYITDIRTIDFPTRLSSIEGHVASMSSGFNNLQNTSITIKDELLRIERENNKKTDELAKENAAIKTFLYVSIAIGVISIILKFVKF